MLVVNSLVLVLVLILDQATKFWAESQLQTLEPIPFLNNYFELHYSQNTGMAFSLLQDRPRFLLVLISVILLTLIYYIFKEKKLRLGIALILAGGLGNLLDRLIHGYVIDFINPLFVNFAIFNIADISLNIGMFLLFIDWIITSFPSRKREMK